MEYAQHDAVPTPALGCVAAVLVGGRSRRMGTDKALCDWAGRPLVMEVAARLRRVTARLLLVGGRPESYSGLGLPHLGDTPELAGAGPIAGLVTVLRLTADPVLLVGCDMPFCDPGIIRRLVAWAGPAPAAAVRLDGRLQPLLGLYRRGVLAAARASLARGSGRLTDLFATPGSRVVEAQALGRPEDVRRCFASLDRPEELARLRPGAGEKVC